LRLQGPGAVVEVHDDLLGPVHALVDDVVLRRNDGVPAYNLAVVVDDAAQGVQQVVRGDDLASSAPRQRFLADALDLPPVTYAHVALVLGPAGRRLAKRDGAVTLGQQRALGHPPPAVCGLLAWSIGLLDAPEPVAPGDLVAGFDPGRLRREAWTFDAGTVGS
jgi:glutamyl-tRNA synthetase